MPDQIPAFEEASPTFGDVFAWGLIDCHGIQVQATEPRPRDHGRGRGADRGRRHDARPRDAVPVGGALADQLESGVLVSRDGDGHTGYNSGNECVDDAVEGYLVDGTVPEDGLEC